MTTMRTEIRDALAKGQTTFRYTGEAINTRGQYGEYVENVHRLAWTPDRDWHESPNGHAWGVWDSTFGWQVWFHLTEDEIGFPIS